MIGEIQFLTIWLLKAKKRGHAIYGIKRRFEFVDAISQMRSQDSDYIAYTQKLTNIVSNSNSEEFTREMIWNPNTVLSLMCGNNKLPLLYLIGRANSNSNSNSKNSKAMKLFSMFLGAMMHFENRFLGSDSDFMKRYLNNVEINSNSLIEKNIFVKLFVCCLFVC